jgi:hypothetical protein
MEKIRICEEECRQIEEKIREEHRHIAIRRVLRYDIVEGVLHEARQTGGGLWHLYSSILVHKPCGPAIRIFQDIEAEKR